MKRNKIFKIVFLVIVVLLVIYGIQRSISLKKQPSQAAFLFTPTPTPSPEEKIPLAEEELLTQEDLKALKEITISKPQAREETQALTKEDVRFLLDEKIVTQEEAKALLELDKLVPTN